jgi:hypothetical protein
VQNRTEKGRFEMRGLEQIAGTLYIHL